MKGGEGEVAALPQNNRAAARWLYVVTSEEAGNRGKAKCAVYVTAHTHTCIHKLPREGGEKAWGGGGFLMIQTVSVERKCVFRSERRQQRGAADCHGCPLRFGLMVLRHTHIGAGSKPVIMESVCLCLWANY